MPSYFYIAKSLKGEEKTGVLEAKDQHQLARTLRQEGYILISAYLEKKALKKRKFELNILAKIQGVPLTEKMIFTRNLQVMISAGISLPRVLRTLAEQTKNQKFQKVLSEITEEVVKGKSFSESLRSYPDIFSELFCSMVKTGEETGNLDEVLKVLTRQMEREHELKSKIKGALMYPAVIICAMIGIGILMLVMVIPQLAATFEELEVELPPTTKFVIFLGSFFSEKWYLVILIVIFFLLLLRYASKTEKGKKIIDSVSLKIPIISPIIRKTNSAYTVRTLSSLISAGVPIVRALEIVSETLGNIYFKEAITEAAEKVRKGSKLSETLRPYSKLYPLVVIQMIEVGEETGETSNILQK